jgi:hypothetical protein
MIEALRTRFQQHRDLLLLLMLLLLMITHPMLEHGTGLRLVQALLMFLTMFLASMAASQKQGWFWLPLGLLAGSVLCGIAAVITSHWAFKAVQWASVTIFFIVIVTTLFSYLRNARVIQRPHLYTAASIYLLIAMLWFALYAAIEAVHPGSFLHAGTPLTDPRSELLYFSLVTLTTVGYGDIVPVGGATRILSALEAGAGVLYVAITVATIVGAHKRNGEE